MLIQIGVKLSSLLAKATLGLRVLLIQIGVKRPRLMMSSRISLRVLLIQIGVKPLETLPPIATV